MTAVLSMRQAAAEVGMSYDRFRKEWPRLRAEFGFPLPFMPHRWEAEAVRSWRAARSAGAPAAASPRAGGPGRASRDRRQLDALRAG